MPKKRTRSRSARDAAHPSVASPDPPTDIGMAIHLKPPADAEVGGDVGGAAGGAEGGAAGGAGAGAGDPPPPSFVPWPIAVELQQQYIAEGLTRGPPRSPNPLPDPLIPPRETDPALNYTLVRNAGKGTFGTVDIVKDKGNDDKQFALKTMQLDPTKPRRTLMARREATIMKRLDHKNICQLYSTEIYAGTAVLLLMEPCVMSLKEYIKDVLIKMTGDLEKDKLAEIKHIAIGLLEGMIYMHGERVLHRDLKAANILMKQNGGLLITDFGVARKIEKKMKGRTRRYTRYQGTHSTMAPEVLLGVSDYGFETDMWSVGCVIGQMFAGRTVFKAQIPKDKVSMLNAIMELCGDIQLPQPHPPGLKATGNTRTFRPFFKGFVTDRDALDFIKVSLKRKPSTRLSPEKLILHDFLTNNNPAPVKSMRDPSNYSFLRFGYQWPTVE